MIMENNKIYEAKFAKLVLGKGPENDFCWSGYIDVSNKVSSKKIPIYILTKNQRILGNTIEFVQKIVLDFNQYLKASIIFIKETLNEQKENYNIKEDEHDFLMLDVETFPVYMPEITFYEDSIEWILRFSEGKFSICDPFGIGVTFRYDKPISVDNLEDSECIEQINV